MAEDKKDVRTPGEYGCPIPAMQIVMDYDKRGAPIPTMMPVPKPSSADQGGTGNQGGAGNQGSGGGSNPSGGDKKP
jgi:hypothetical protein